MRNVALRIEYDGTDFVGSQWQNNGRSVQGALEAAWEQLTQEQRRINLAGRTDAGVHARGQVASLRTETHHDLATIQRGLNAILPEDVAVLEAWEVPIDFHARHSAIRRDYRYLIDNGRVGSPLIRRHAVHVPQPLDVAAIGEALGALLGRHDFAAFAGGQQEGSTVRTFHGGQLLAGRAVGAAADRSRSGGQRISAAYGAQHHRHAAAGGRRQNGYQWLRGDPGRAAIGGGPGALHRHMVYI